MSAPVRKHSPQIYSKPQWSDISWVVCEGTSFDDGLASSAAVHCCTTADLPQRGTRPKQNVILNIQYVDAIHEREKGARGTRELGKAGRPPERSTGAPLWSRRDLSTALRQVYAH